MNERFKERKARLAQLERELDLLKKQRRAIERDIRREELPEEWLDSRKGGASPSRAPSAAPVPRGGSEPASPGPLPESLAEVPEERERFAQYFMTGSLGRHTPQLRRERRAMRNKAIVTAVLALILLFALVHFLLRSH